jgi:hypothetical protein
MPVVKTRFPVREVFALFSGQPIIASPPQKGAELAFG